MKEAYIDMMLKHGETDSLSACLRVQTKELGGDLSVAFLGADDEKHLATTLDIIAYANPDAWNSLSEEVQNVTLAEALLPMMPEFYTIMYSEAEREPNLARITTKQIMKLTGLAEKFKNCAKI